jgi:carbon storage regulator
VLVLSRKPEQSIMVGDDVEITVCSVSGDTVRLGIQAPRSVAVHRREIYLEIHGGEGDPPKTGSTAPEAPPPLSR